MQKTKSTKGGAIPAAVVGLLSPALMIFVRVAAFTATERIFALSATEAIDKEMTEDFLTYGTTPDPTTWAEIDTQGNLLFFDEAKARRFVESHDPLFPPARVACLVLAVLAAERERAPFSKIEFLEV